MIKPGMTLAEKVRIKASPEWQAYLNSPEIVEAQRKTGVKVRAYKEKRRKLHEKHASEG